MGQYKVYLLELDGVYVYIGITKDSIVGRLNGFTRPRKQWVGNTALNEVLRTATSISISQINHSATEDGAKQLEKNAIMEHYYKSNIVVLNKFLELDNNKRITIEHYVRVGQSRCYRCKKWKDEKEFSKDVNRPRGLNASCKKCWNEWMRNK